jgi:Tripartite tricarboxylate transporter family receptor
MYCTVTYRTNLMKGKQKEVVVENKPGATNQVAAEFVARSAADGYTLLVCPEATFVTSIHICSEGSPARDFVDPPKFMSLKRVSDHNPSQITLTTSRGESRGSCVAAGLDCTCWAADVQRREFEASVAGKVPSASPYRARGHGPSRWGAACPPPLSQQLPRSGGQCGNGDRNG